MGALETAAETVTWALEGPPLEARVARIHFAQTGEAMLASLTKEDLTREIVGTFQVVVLLREDGGTLTVRGFGMRGHTLASPVERTADVVDANPEALSMAESIWSAPLDRAAFDAAFRAWVARLLASSLTATRKVYEHRMRWEDEKPPSMRDVGKRISSGFPIVEANAFNASGGRVRLPKPLLNEFE